MHHHFNAAQLVDAHQVSYKPFHNQLRKASFRPVHEALVEQAIAQLRIGQQMKTASLGAFKQVLLQDGTSFAVHKKPGRVFPEGSRPLARGNPVSYAHVSLDKVQFACRSLPIRRQNASSDLSPERLNNNLLLADAGYIDMAYFAKELSGAGGFYLVRG